MKLNNLSRLGILNGILLIIFFIGLVTVFSSRIHQIYLFTEVFKEFDEYPPTLPSLEIPIAVIVLSLIGAFVTGLMIYHIIQESLIFIGLWLIIFVMGLSIEMIYVLNDLYEYFAFERLLLLYSITATQILLISPVAMIFKEISRKKRTHQPYNKNTI